MGNATTSILAQASESALGASTLGRQEHLFSWGGYFQALAVLCLIIAALWFGLWYLKRRGTLSFMGNRPGLALETHMSLGPKKMIAVVRCSGKRLLLGVTDQQITLLTELSAELPGAEPGEAAPAKAPVSFTQLLKQETPRDTAEN